MFALGTGSNAISTREDLHEDEAAWRRGEERLGQEEAKRAKNQYYRSEFGPTELSSFLGEFRCRAHLLFFSSSAL